MGQVVFVLLVVGCLGFFFYRQLGVARGEAERESNQRMQRYGKLGNEFGRDNAKAKCGEADSRIVEIVVRTPGILQTEIYAAFPDENRKTLQALLLRMDRDGSLKREREGSSYRLYVA